MRRTATIMSKERMMSRSTERMVTRMAMKAREGWGLTLAPKIWNWCDAAVPLTLVLKSKLTPTPPIPWLGDPAGLWGKKPLSL